MRNREYTYLGTDGVATDQKCLRVWNSRLSANQICSDELFSLLIMEKLTLFSLNATHDGCRVVDARFLASFGSMTPRNFIKNGKNTTFFIKSGVMLK
mgnify:FL=1